MILNKEKTVFLIAIVLCTYGIIDCAAQTSETINIPDLPAISASNMPVSVTIPKLALFSDDSINDKITNDHTGRNPFVEPKRTQAFSAPTVPLPFPPAPPVMHLAPSLSESIDEKTAIPKLYEKPPAPVEEIQPHEQSESQQNGNGEKSQ
ncbi:MAG: hypothetical protein ABIH42_11150 [Planctomycetota bacterium]